MDNSSKNADSFRLSVAIPVYNEQEVLPELLERTRNVLDALEGGPHELVFVDDGSTDDTLSQLQTEAERDPRIRVIALSRNFGQQAAYTAALRHVTGDAVVLMDGDLQDSPEAIPELVRYFQMGYDVVYAIRKRRKEGWLLRSAYAVFYRLISSISNVALPRDAGDFCLVSRRVVDGLNRTPERHRYLRGLRAWIGYRQIGIPIERDSRAAGKAKYNLRRLVHLALDGIFSFSIAPLRMATILGILTIGVTFVAAGYSLYAKFVYQDSPAGFTWLAVSMAFFAGVQLVFLGIIGEYIGRIYEEVKQRPLYVVDQVIGKDSTWIQNTPKNIDDCTTSIGGGDLAKR